MFDVILIGVLALTVAAGVACFLSLWRAFERDEELVKKVREVRARKAAEQHFEERQQEQSMSSSPAQVPHERVPVEWNVPSVVVPRIVVPKIKMPSFNLGTLGSLDPSRQAEVIARAWSQAATAMANQEVKNVMRMSKQLMSIQVPSITLKPTTTQRTYSELIEEATPDDIEERFREIEELYGRSA